VWLRSTKEQNEKKISGRMRSPRGEAKVKRQGRGPQIGAGPPQSVGKETQTHLQGGGDGESGPCATIQTSGSGRNSAAGSNQEPTVGCLSAGSPRGRPSAFPGDPETPGSAAASGKSR